MAEEKNAENHVVGEIIEKIARECGEAKATKWDIIRIVQELEGESGDEERMRQKALALLEKLNPEAARIYASFYRMAVHNSQQEIRPFDRGNIVKSLLRETKISRSAAEKIGSEVEDRLKDLKINYLTTSIIREMANAKLLEYGLEDVRNEYARVGLPAFDVEKKILKNDNSFGEALEEFNISKPIPKELGELHFNSDIFIDDLAGFSSRALACSVETEKTDSYLDAVRAFAEKAAAMRGLFQNNANFDSFNLAFDASKKEDRPIAPLEIAQTLLSDGSRGCVGISLFVPDEIKLGQTEKKASMEFAGRLAKAAAREAAHFETKACVDDQFKHKLLNESGKRKITFINCLEKRRFAFNGRLYSEKNAILCSVSVNLQKIALESGADERVFFEGLAEKASAVRQLAEIKEGLLARKQDFERHGFKLSGMEKILALTPLLDAAETVIGKSPEKDLVSFAEKIVRRAQETFPGAKITPLVSQDAKKRFQRACREKFGYDASLSDKSNVLLKSAFLAKNFVAKANAKNAQELEELLKAGVPLVGFS